MRKFLTIIQLQLKDHNFILLGFISGLVILSIPLQLHMSLGRYQHYGLALFAFGLGYIIQTVWSWRHLARRPRLGYAITGLYLTSIGFILYANPWLDTRVTAITEEKENLKALIGWIYAIACLPLACVYLNWAADSRGLNKDKGGQH